MGASGPIGMAIVATHLIARAGASAYQGNISYKLEINLPHNLRTLNKELVLLRWRKFKASLVLFYIVQMQCE